MLRIAPYKFGNPAAMAGFSLARFMAAQTAGLYYDFTKTDRHFQENVGPTLADDVGEAIGLALDQRQWNGQTLAQVLAAASELNTSVWTDRSIGTGAASYSNGTVTLTGVDAANRGAMDTPFTTVVGKTYRAFINVASVAGPMNFKVCAAASGNSAIASNNSISAGVSSIIFTATSTTTYIYLQTGTAAGAYVINSVSCKLVPGIPAIQATGTLKPARQTAGAKFDGSDDNLLTSYVAGSGANFIVALVDVPASIPAAQIVGGAADTVSGWRTWLGIHTTGVARAGVGTNGSILGTTDLRSTLAVIGLSLDASTVRVFANQAQETEIALAGGTAVVSPFRLGCFNSGSTPASFFGGSIKKLVAGREFLTLSRYNQIRNALLAA